MKVLKGIGIFFGFLVVIALMYGITFGTGLIDLKFQKFFGVEKANIQREIFKEGQSYVEGMSNDLSNYKHEITIEKDPIAKQAIVDLILNKYGNFDTSKLESPDLQRFLLDVRNGKYNIGGQYNE